LPKNGISLEGIIIFLEKILAKTPNPKLLWSIPVSHAFTKAIARAIAPHSWDTPQKCYSGTKIK
jgi:hypothetical protein